MMNALKLDISSRTVQRKLSQLVADGRIVKIGKTRGAIYQMASPPTSADDVRRYVCQPLDIVENELLNLHEGNYARFRLRPSEFSAWYTLW